MTQIQCEWRQSLRVLDTVFSLTCGPFLGQQTHNKWHTTNSIAHLI